MSSSGVVYRTNPYTGKSTWTYGNWGGGGWSNGEFTPPGQTPDFTGPTQGKLDETFRNHDERYQKAQDAYESSSRTDADKAAYWDKLIQADKDMLREMSDLRKSGQLGNPPGSAPASPDYVAASEASMAFWLVLKEREKSRDMLADPRRQYEDGEWQAPLPPENPNPNGPLPEDPYYGSAPLKEDVPTLEEVVVQASRMSSAEELAYEIQTSGAFRVERQLGGAFTYTYTNGVKITNNAVSGEYHMVVPNTDGGGGQTVFTRTYDTQTAQFTVTQVQTNAAGTVVYDFTGR